MDYSDPNQAEWALQDPATPAEALAVIAQAHPGLRDRVVTHPNAYPQLVTWIAAQSTSAVSPSMPPQSSAGPSYGPAQPQPYGAPAQQQPYGPAQPAYGPTPQQYQAPPSAPGQPYYGPGGYPAGPPAKKKTGLIVGLVGGGVLALAVVAVLGVFVFHWFGGSDEAPTLTKSQVESFLDSDFMEDLSGDSADDYYYSHLDRDDLEDMGGSDGECSGLVEIMTDADNWSSTASVTRFSKSVSPGALEDAAVGCDTLASLDVSSVHDQDGGGWWAMDDDTRAITFSYGNVWLDVVDVADSDDEIQDMYDDFAEAIRAAAK